MNQKRPALASESLWCVWEQCYPLKGLTVYAHFPGLCLVSASLLLLFCGPGHLRIPLPDDSFGPNSTSTVYFYFLPGTLGNPAWTGWHLPPRVNCLKNNQREIQVAQITGIWGRDTHACQSEKPFTKLGVGEGIAVAKDMKATSLSPVTRNSGKSYQNHHLSDHSFICAFIHLSCGAQITEGASHGLSPSLLAPV